MNAAERARAILALQAELDESAQQLVGLKKELKQRLTRLQTSRANVWRDGIGAGAGIAFAGLTSGYSLLLTFWTMTSLLVDVLAVLRERQAIREMKERLGNLLERQSKVVAEIEELEAKAL